MILERFFFHLFVHSLVDFYTCSDWGLNSQPWYIRTILSPTELPGQGLGFALCCLALCATGAFTVGCFAVWALYHLHLVPFGSGQDTSWYWWAEDPSTWVLIWNNEIMDPNFVPMFPLCLGSCYGSGLGFILLYREGLFCFDSLRGSLGPNFSRLVHD